MFYTIAVLFLAVLGGATGWRDVTVQPGDSDAGTVEQPRYTVVAQREGYELRRYAPHIVAEVEVEGGENEAMSRGFRPLADYIFGNNRKHDRLPMTSPVTQRSSYGWSERIPMTSPVTQRRADNGDAGASDSSGTSHVVAFIMPSNYSMETLPTPVDQAVRLRAVPGQVMAVAAFSGAGDAGAMREQAVTLLEQLERDGLEAMGLPLYARYDPPWTPAERRRNEVLVEVKDPAPGD